MNQGVRKIALAIQKLFNGFDSAVKKSCDDLTMDEYPPIFMVGAPRTGSTMIFQVMVSQLRLAYISNIMALMPSLMVKLCMFSRRVACGYDGGIRESEYGYIPGLLSPNEAGKIADKWFDAMISDEEKKYVGRTFRMISSITKCRFLMKNQMNTLRIKQIRAVLPDSRFILLRRAPPFYSAIYFACASQITRQRKPMVECTP